MGTEAKNDFSVDGATKIAPPAHDLRGQLSNALTQIFADHNKSLLTRATLYWGGVSRWYKWGYGALFIAALFLSSFIPAFPAIAVFIMCSFIGYIGFSWLLGENYQSIYKRKFSGLTSLADNFVGVWQSDLNLLKSAAAGIGEAHEQMESQNKRFITNMSVLQKHNTELQQEMQRLSKVIGRLNDDNSKLGSQSLSLEIELQKQKKLLENAQKELEQAICDIQSKTKTLSEFTEKLECYESTEAESMRGIINLTALLESKVGDASSQPHSEDDQQLIMQKKYDAMILQYEKKIRELREQVNVFQELLEKHGQKALKIGTKSGVVAFGAFGPGGGNDERDTSHSSTPKGFV